MKLKNLKTRYLGQTLLYFDCLDSTQKKIKSLEAPKNGTVVIANRQTAGVGTHGRDWYTGEGKNIALSFVLFPDCKLENCQELTVSIAKCLVETLEELYDVQLEIEMPNDIYCKGKKLGGILTESVCKGEMVTKIYVGIGMNVNQEEFPEDLREIATSLKKEFGREFEQEEIVEAFLNRFEDVFEKMIKS